MEAERQSKRDRIKLIAMFVGLVLVLGAYLVSNLQEKKHLQIQEGVLEEEAPFSEYLAVKEFDATAVADQILDSRPEDRVLLPSKVTLPFTEYVFGLNDVHYHAIGLEPLDAEHRAAIETDPALFRGQAFRARGRLEGIKSRERLDGKTEYKGWLRDESGLITHFIVMDVPEEVELNGYMRFDGLFVKLYSREDHEGTWIEGPLLVGSQMVSSYPDANPESLTAEVILDRLARVKDDTAQDSTGLDGTVYRAQWALMDFAQTEAYAAIDWEKDAVELNNETMTSILKDGDAWRYRLSDNEAEDPRAQKDLESGLRPMLDEDLIPIPIRIPVSRNMGINTIDPGENPSRLDSITTGWVGNWTWTNQAGIIKFVMPGGRPDLKDFKNSARLVQGKGFFLKNHNYESMDHGTRTAPYFVLTELETFTPVENNLVQSLMWGFMVLTLLLGGLFLFLLMRDRKKSQELQRDLVRRKQERRRRLAAVDQGQS
jgi:hypothetical protein